MKQSFSLSAGILDLSLLLAVAVLEQPRPTAARALVRPDLDALLSRGSFEQVAERVAARLERHARALERSLRRVEAVDADAGEASAAASHSDLRFESSGGDGSGRRWRQQYTMRNGMSMRSDSASGSSVRAHGSEREDTRVESSALSMLHRRVQRMVMLVQRALLSGEQIATRLYY